MDPAELFEIARRLVEEAGPEALTMDRLAEAAGISRSTAYRLVGSREALVQRLAAAGVDIGERGDARERVLAGAREVFSRHGLEAATIDAIAEAAGVGTATIYRQFGDKPGLVAAFIENLGPRKLVWASAREPSGDLAADLERLACSVLQHMARNHDIMRLFLIEQLRGNSLLGDLASAPDRSVHGLAMLFRHYACELVDEDPYRLARAFQGLMAGFGLFGALFALPAVGDPERDSKLCVDLFLRGARRGTP